MRILDFFAFLFRLGFGGKGFIKSGALLFLVGRVEMGDGYVRLYTSCH